MAIVNVLVAWWPTLSVTRNVKAKVPAVVGVPVIRPGDDVSERPGGSGPAATDQR